MLNIIEKIVIDNYKHKWKLSMSNVINRSKRVNVYFENQTMYIENYNMIIKCKFQLYYEYSFLE